MENPRKRKHSSKDSGKVGRGKCFLSPKGQPHLPYTRQGQEAGLVPLSTEERPASQSMCDLSTDAEGHGEERNSQQTPATEGSRAGSGTRVYGNFFPGGSLMLMAFHRE